MEEFSHALAYIKLSTYARSRRMQKQKDTKEQEEKQRILNRSFSVTG